MKKAIILALLLVMMVSACDALPGSGESQVTPPAEVGVADVGYLSKVIFDIQNAISGNYRAVIGGVEFSCRTYEDHPDQLYCFGPELPVGEYQAEIYLGSGEQPVLSTTVVVSGNVVVVTATAPPATPTPVPTETPVPIPTATATAIPEGTQPPAGGVPPTSAPPTAAAPTLSADESVKVFYFKLDEAGRYGCGEAMYWVKSSQPITSNMVNNISYGLRMLFSYHQPYFGELYNPYGNSNNQFAVGSIELTAEGTANVFLTGTYERSKDECDPSRLRDQLIRIVTQFEGINRAFIYLNGTRIEDAFQRK